MLRFLVYQGGEPATHFDLAGAYVIGADHVPIRADFEFSRGELIIRKKAQGPAAVAVLWPVRSAGRILLETTRLKERDRPYNLNLELARGQMMRIQQKREDWGLFDVDNIEKLVRSCGRAQENLIEAIKASDMATAARQADEVLFEAIALGESMSLFHAGVFLGRRRMAGQIGRRLFGCGVNSESTSEIYHTRLRNGFDFVSLPLCWRTIEPKEGEYDWSDLDRWVEHLVAAQIPIKAGSLVSFHENNVPDWLTLYEHDFEAVRHFVGEHLKRVVERYGRHVQLWAAATGIHAYNAFGFNFEQLMELSRLAVGLTKQLAPQTPVLIDIVAPWGEYYARNQRTIPPLLYADMIIQNNINFDALGLELNFGVGVDGLFVRDMFQVSAMLDRFATYGKPLHITAAQTPSGASADPADAWAGQYEPHSGGAWHDPWTEALQSRWLREFYNIALSKPFIDTITWRDLADEGAHFLPHGGLLRTDLSPKLAYEQLCTIRAQIHGNDQPRSAV